MSKVNREIASPRLHIAMFGRFRVEIDGVPLKPHRPTDLHALACLLLHHDTPVDRLTLAALWKKSEQAPFVETDARAYLTRAVSELTTRLGSEGGRLRKPQPQLLFFEAAGADLDLLEWEAGLAEGNVDSLERIAPLYRLSLLTGWDDAWVLAARERLRTDYRQALRAAARREIVHSRWKAALRGFTLLCEVDPWHEETLREHLQLLADRRRFQEMQQRYDAYARHCEAVGAPTDPRTTQHYRDLRAEADRCPHDLVRGWIPNPLSRFIPRPAEIAAIEACVQVSRLTTLTGAGGVGKTRLAITAAQALHDAFYDGVWFLDLSELQDPAEVPTQVARTLRLTENPNRTPTEEILACLRAQETLLVLDNCEHVLEASARLAARILENCPDVKILTTSRQPLGIIGETLWRVPSLDFPGSDARLTPKKLAQYGAVRLLIERASRPQFPLTIDTENADAIARICRRLDGIPLAIELAAVQITRRSRSVQEVADSLDQTLAFLTEGSSTAPSRQQTLRAAIAWSYQLLNSVEQQVFERLGVFVGGFMEEAACQVCGTAPATPESVADALKTIADKSLLELLPSEQGLRYHLLQTIRQFALDRLAVRQGDPAEAAPPEHAGDDARIQTSRRHLHYFKAFVEEAERHHRGADHAQWLDRQDREHENCRAALAWALQQGEYDTGLRLATNLAGYLYTRGHHSEATEWLAAFLKCTSSSAPARLMAVHWAGNIAYVRADYATARTYFEESLALREIRGDPRDIAVGRASLATAIGGLGSHAEALALFEANLLVFQELKDLRNTALTWNSIAVIADARGDLPRARDCNARSLQLFREAGDLANVSMAAGNLAGLYIEHGDYTAARPLLAECLELYRTLRTRHRFVYLLSHSLCLAVREQAFERAAIVLGFAKAFRESIGFVLPPKLSECFQAEETAVRQHLSAARFD
ncbi:MAG: transcriptional regulator, LuxR family, partial [Chthonomonadales bacterium]|nr:transcriptional regulator, LuxR family [Chthonomonadales bacterium]